MDLNQLISFVSVVKNQSFTKAANELFISQPTVSSHVKNLEHELNKQLIIRSTKTLIVTDYGWELYEVAKQMLNIQNNLFSSWEQNKQRVNKIGASTIPSTYVLPNALSAYAKRYEPLSFNLYQGDSIKIIENLKHGDYDIAFSGMEANDEKIISTPFFEDEMVLIVPNNEHFKSYVGLDNAIYKILKSEPIIFREEGSASQKKTLELLNCIGIDYKNLNIIAKVNEPEAIKNFIIHGFAVAIISKVAVQNLIDAGKVLCFTLPEQYSKRNLYILQNKSIILDKQLKNFIDFLSSYYKVLP